MKMHRGTSLILIISLVLSGPTAMVAFAGLCVSLAALVIAAVEIVLRPMEFFSNLTLGVVATAVLPPFGVMSLMELWRIIFYTVDGEFYILGWRFFASLICGVMNFVLFIYWFGAEAFSWCAVPLVFLLAFLLHAQLRIQRA